MPIITLPDGNNLDFPKKVTGLEVAEKISKMGNNGRENVVKKFNVEKMCFSTYSEYKKLFN